MEAAPRARDPINQLLPQLTFPAPKGVVLKRLGNVLSQLDCIFKLASFTWERKTRTNVEQSQSRCSQQAGDPSSFSSIPREVAAAAAVSAALGGRAVRYRARFRWGKSTLVHQRDERDPALEYCGSEMQLAVLVGFFSVAFFMVPLFV